MIIVGVCEDELAKTVTSMFHRNQLASAVVNPGSQDFISRVYQDDVIALILDHRSDLLPADALVDISNAISSRIPVFIITNSDLPDEFQNFPLSGSRQFSERISFVSPKQIGNVAATIRSLLGQARPAYERDLQFIPSYHSQIPSVLLRRFGGLAILTVDASSLNKISVEYGSDVYQTVKKVFQDVMLDLWGRPGAFRDSDIICRLPNSPNMFYIFMNSSRKTGALPNPGVLEQVADRVSSTIYNALWSELDGTGKGGRLPACLQTIPLIGVGFSGVLDNPCISVEELIDGGLESSKKMAQAQLRRSRERQRELMQTLIQSENLLTPHFQGVFRLQGLEKHHMEKAQKLKSLKPLEPFIFGFESLIRVNENEIRQISSFSGGLDFKFLKPEVLFSLAKQTKVALELDQACMRMAADEAKDLPGTLMVNILPRNLYYVDRLESLFSGVKRIMLEVSESEAISNQDLMLRAREHLSCVNIQIAADDFGRGYSSLERIIRVRPNVIKFDRSMVCDIDKDKVKEAYVRGLVQAAKILNTTILAEGVERWEEAVVLRQMGVDLIQGFLFHKPQRCKKILQQLNQKRGRSSLETVA